MSAPTIHGTHVPSSAFLNALGDALSRIRQEDRLTWADIGVVLGRSEDQAAKYADGSAEMGAIAYYRARQAWNGRFTGEADRLIEAHETMDAQQAQSCILKAALALSVALEDGELTVAEIRQNKSTLENAKDAIEAQLGRLASVRAA